MGCSVSTVAIPGKQLRPLSSAQGFFTEQQKKTIAKTWKYMGTDLTARGSKVFLRIFQKNPSLKNLFPFRNCEGEELLKNTSFKGHASRFMQAVGAVVDNIDDPETALSPLLIDLGRNHISFEGFQPEYFSAFTEAMQFVWRTELNVKYTPDVADTWDMVFNFIMQTLKEGYMREEENRLETSDKGTVTEG